MEVDDPARDVNTFYRMTVTLGTRSCTQRSEGHMKLLLPLLQTNCSMKYSLTVSTNLVSTSVIAAATATQAPGWPGSSTARRLEENERAPKRKKGRREQPHNKVSLCTFTHHIAHGAPGLGIIFMIFHELLFLLISNP